MIKSKEIVEKYTSGLTMQSIASEYGVSKQSVHQILNKSGVVRNVRLSLRNKAIVNQFKSGMDIKLISADTGISIDQLYRILRLNMRGYNERDDRNLKIDGKTNEIIAKYEAGASGPALAAEYKVSRETIYRLVKRSGVNVRKAGRQSS